MQPLSIREGFQQWEHVARHLYDLREGWRHICPELAERPLDEIARVGVRWRFDKWGKPRLVQPVPEAGQRRMDRDHERFYRPAYERALREPHPDAPGPRPSLHATHVRDAWCGANGVLVFVAREEERGERRVVSAYRPTLENPEDKIDYEYVDEAVRLFGLRTSFSRDDAGAEENAA